MHDALVLTSDRFRRSAAVLGFAAAFVMILTVVAFARTSGTIGGPGGSTEAQPHVSGDRDGSGPIHQQ